MSIIDGARHVAWSLLHRRAADAETREELAFHIERQTDKYVTAGFDPVEARRKARIDLGGMGRWREETADARRGTAFRDLSGDVRYALRGLAARPGFTLASLATLAIGIGAGTTAFGLLDGALLRGLPFPNANRLMSIALRMPTQAGPLDMVWSYPKYAYLADHQGDFTAMAVHAPESYVVTWPDVSEHVQGEMVGQSYFDVLGVHPDRGREFDASEERPGSSAGVVIVSDEFRRNHFDGRNAIGQSVRMGKSIRTIVGVMPAGFAGMSGRAQLWIPVPAARSLEELQSANSHNMQLVALLRPGASAASARSAVAVLGGRVDEAFPDRSGHWGAAGYTLAELRLNGVIRRTLELLTIAVTLLLGIVCVNLTTLWLTRSAARRQELAVRVALGGGRGRIVRQLMTECMCLSVIGCAVALPAALVLIRFLAGALPLAVPTAGAGTDLSALVFGGIHLDARIAVLCVAFSMVIAAAIGAIAAFRGRERELFSALRSGASSMAGARRPFTSAYDGLAVAQVALAVMFLVSSGLTLESLDRTLRVPLGYDPANVMMASVALDPARVTYDSAPALWARVLNEVRGAPGVSGAALASSTPVDVDHEGTSIALLGASTEFHVAVVRVGDGYFATIKTPVVRGREFSAHEADRAHAVIINEAAARAIWGSRDPLTSPLYGDSLPRRVIGVVADARYGDLDRPVEPTIFVPFPFSHGTIVVRGSIPAAAMSREISDAVHRAGRGHVIDAVEPMAARLRQVTIRNRLAAIVFSALAASALLLASVGVYGTLALRVAQRSRELAIRRALGASASAVGRLVVSHALVVAGAGAVAGGASAVLVNRAMASLLHDLSPLEPSVYALAGGALAVATVVAATLPTVRSLRVHPREAMRAE